MRRIISPCKKIFPEIGRPRNHLEPIIEFTEDTRRAVLAEVEKTGASVIVEVGVEKRLIPLKLKPQKDYLRGLMQAAKVHAQAKQDMGHKGPRTHLNYTQAGLERRVDECAADFYRRNDPGEEDLSLELDYQLNFYDYRANLSGPVYVKLKDLPALSPRVGVVQHVAGRPGVFDCYYLSEPKNKYRVHGGRTSAIGDIAKDKCPLVIEKADKGRYLVLYSDLDKSYLRALYDVQILAEYAQKAPSIAGTAAIELFEKSLRTLINDTRKNLGLSPLRKNDNKVNFDIDYTKIPAFRDRSL